MREFINRMKNVKFKDIIAFVPCLYALIYVKINRKNSLNLWLICEEMNEARDNGYWLFKYICEKHPEQKVIYAINKRSVDYFKVKNLGEIVQFGSIKHWIYYFSAFINISSQKGGKPNAAICYLLEIYNLNKNKRVFLQHGVTINNPEWLRYNVTKFSLFICGAKPEVEFIRKKLNYPENSVVYTGFSRFDNLFNNDVKMNKVIIMPTWRSWFILKSKNDGEINTNFSTSEFLSSWKSVLCSVELKDIIETYDLEVCFYPHRNMQQYLNFFDDVPNYINLLDWRKTDIQEELKSSAILITDYSSVFFDFIYMKKPILFYQFDQNQFKKYQYDSGWFDYENNQFSEFAKTEKKLFNSLKTMCENKFKVNKNFLNKHKEYFEFYDERNSERIYEEILKLGDRDES